MSLRPEIVRKGIAGDKPDLMESHSRVIARKRGGRSLPSGWGRNPVGRPDDTGELASTIPLPIHRNAP